RNICLGKKVSHLLFAQSMLASDRDQRRSRLARQNHFLEHLGRDRGSSCPNWCHYWTANIGPEDSYTGIFNINDFRAVNEDTVLSTLGHKIFLTSSRH